MMDFAPLRLLEKVQFSESWVSYQILYRDAIKNSLIGLSPGRYGARLFMPRCIEIASTIMARFSALKRQQESSDVEH